jgi:hypothetical protein
MPTDELSLGNCPTIKTSTAPHSTYQLPYNQKTNCPTIKTPTAHNQNTNCSQSKHQQIKQKLGNLNEL